MNVMNCTTFRMMAALFFLASCLVMGCSPKPRLPESVLDTPEHHVSSGLKLLGKNYLIDARREFELALQLNPNCSDAHRGLGLTYGAQKQFEPAFEAMRKARDTARTNQETALAYVGFMRLYTMEGADLWLEKVKARFSDALQYQRDLPDAYFYLGVAYKKAHQPSDAESAFKKVLEINNGLVLESEHELKSLSLPK